MIKKSYLNDGIIISQGTLKPDDILERVKDFFQMLETSKPLTEEPFQQWREIAQMKQDIDNLLKTQEFIIDRYRPCSEEHKMINRIIEEFFFEEIIEFVNEIIPENYYFGSSDGDGALIGIFQTRGDE